MSVMNMTMTHSCSTIMCEQFQKKSSHQNMIQIVVISNKFTILLIAPVQTFVVLWRVDVVFSGLWLEWFCEILIGFGSEGSYLFWWLKVIALLYCECYMSSEMLMRPYCCYEHFPSCLKPSIPKLCCVCLSWLFSIVKICSEATCAYFGWLKYISVVTLFIATTCWCLSKCCKV
jgi:hypothetical protein